AAGIRQMREELRRLGGTITQDQAEAAARYNDEITRLNAKWESFSRTLVLKAVPALASVLEYLNKSGDAFRDDLADRVAHWEATVDTLTKKLATAQAELAEAQEQVTFFRAGRLQGEV